MVNWLMFCVAILVICAVNFHDWLFISFSHANKFNKINCCQIKRVYRFGTNIFAVCIYRLVMMSIDLSATAHFGQWHGRNNNPVATLYQDKLTTDKKPTVGYSIPDEIPTTCFQLCELV